MGMGDKKTRAKRFTSPLHATVNDVQVDVRDISSGGMYIVQTESRSIGSKIDFTLDLDDQRLGTIHLSCIGEIVRVEQEDGKVGIGLKIVKQSGLKLLLHRLNITPEAWEKREE